MRRSLALRSQIVWIPDRGFAFGRSVNETQNSLHSGSQADSSSRLSGPLPPGCYSQADTSPHGTPRGLSCEAVGEALIRLFQRNGSKGPGDALIQTELYFEELAPVIVEGTSPNSGGSAGRRDPGNGGCHSWSLRTERTQDSPLLKAFN